MFFSFIQKEQRVNVFPEDVPRMHDLLAVGNFLRDAEAS